MSPGTHRDDNYEAWKRARLADPGSTQRVDWRRDYDAGPERSEREPEPLLKARDGWVADIFWYGESYHGQREAEPPR